MILKIELFDVLLYLMLIIANPNLTPNSHKPHARYHFDLGNPAAGRPSLGRKALVAEGTKDVCARWGLLSRQPGPGTAGG